MLLHFSNFEIDEAKREVRSGAHVVEPQRRIFDLLAYLTRHESRVVPKMELLEAVWPGVIVTDNSLQRAVSLARVLLRRAGCAAVIRTHARLGYRLCASDAGTEPTSVEGTPESVRRARKAYSDGECEAAMAAFMELQDLSALEADDLRLWFYTAQCSGRASDAVAPLERAVSLFEGLRDHTRAACAAVLLGQLRLDACEPAPARGWLRRGLRQLEDQPLGREHGYLGFAQCRLALFENDLDAAVHFADLARDLGHRFDDPDLQALGMLYGGEARLYRGEVEAGLAAIDESGAAVVALNLSPWAGGLVYCGIIFSSLTRADWQRAAQWNHQFDRWCQLHHAPGALGLCRLHRAEVLCVEGRLEQAEHEARDAQEVLRRNARWAEGDAWRVLGEIHLARGEWELARECNCRAHELGWNAELGMALLEHANGRVLQAHRVLRRALRDPHWTNRARRGMLLAHFAEIAALADRLDDARAALAELDARPELVSTTALQALVTRARAELANAEGKRSHAIDLMQTALRQWNTIEAPLMAARTRCRLAELLEADGDADLAAMEMAAANATFRRCGAATLSSSPAR